MMILVSPRVGYGRMTYDVPGLYRRTAKKRAASFTSERFARAALDVNLERANARCRFIGPRARVLIDFFDGSFTRGSSC